jgi:hypothetical protein
MTVGRDDNIAPGANTFAAHDHQIVTSAQFGFGGW